MFLTSTTQSLSVTATGGLSGQNPSFVVDYADFDFTNGTVTPGSSFGFITANDRIDILAPPAAGIRRQVKNINFLNGDASLAILFAFSDDANHYPLYSTTSAPQSLISWGYEVGWNPGPETTGRVFSTFQVKTSPYNAEAGDLIAADTSDAPWTLFLPRLPEPGQQVQILDFANTWGTNNLTVDGNGNVFSDNTDTLLCNVDGATFQLVFRGGSPNAWFVNLF